MKATDNFKRTIQAYLNNRAAEDELFACTLSNKSAQLQM